MSTRAYIQSLSPIVPFFVKILIFEVVKRWVPVDVVSKAEEIRTHDL
jgi:hypothetical protein